jgi:hypothetical protein
MSGEKGLSCKERTSGSSIMTMRQLMHHYWFVISVLEIIKDQPELDQVSRVTEEAQFCSCWRKSHESLSDA